jgi:hypothetical protein
MPASSPIKRALLAIRHEYREYALFAKAWNEPVLTFRTWIKYYA